MKGKAVMLGPFGIPSPDALRNGFRGHKGTAYLRLLPMARAMEKKGWDIKVILPPIHDQSIKDRRLDLDGVLVENLHISGTLGPIDHLKIATRMLEGALEYDPNVIHIFKPKGHPGLAAMVLRPALRTGILKKKLIIDTDDLEGHMGWNERMPYSRSERFFFDVQENYLLRRADTVTAASSFLTDFASGLGARNTLYLPNGPSEYRYSRDATFQDESTARRYGLQGSKKYVLLYTQFKEFNWKDAARVYDKILSSSSSAAALIVGAGQNHEEKALFAHLRKRHGKRVVATGFVSPEDVMAVISAASVAIFPYDNNEVNRAKCSVRLIDLLVAGVPTVASPIGELPTYIRDGKTGMLADISDMAEKVISLLEDEDTRDSISKAARRDIWARFSWDKLTEGLARVYSTG